ncbi:MAG: hypothetical protein HWD60_19240 [Defluviicoccus sp.]|nr:MAG: hypothetical protein HWD60_19240 [Defluviicoccus sp.]
MLKAIPLLVIVIIAYNVVVIVSGIAIDAGLFSMRLPSGADWMLTLGDVLILIGLGLLFVEIVKAGRSRRAGVDHALSMVLFVVALLEFLLAPACGTSVFLIITALTLVDVIAGFTVSLSTAQRDISITS